MGTGTASNGSTLMPAAVHNLTIERGRRFTHTFRRKDKLTGLPIVLTGYQATFQIRPTLNSQTILFNFTTANGMLILNAETGTIALEMSAALTLTAPEIIARYEFNLYPPVGGSEAFMKGEVRFETPFLP